MKKILNLIFVVFICNCQNSYQEALFVDPNVSIRSNKQIIPSSERGDFGVHTLSKDTPMYYREFYHNYYTKKSWILTNWGEPDLIEKKNGAEYLIYFQTEERNLKSNISPYGKKHVKLGYKNGKLFYIEGIVPNAMEHSGKTRVVLND